MRLKQEVGYFNSLYLKKNVGYKEVRGARGAQSEALRSHVVES